MGYTIALLEAYKLKCNPKQHLTFPRDRKLTLTVKKFIHNFLGSIVGTIALLSLPPFVIDDSCSLTLTLKGVQKCDSTVLLTFFLYCNEEVIILAKTSEGMQAEMKPKKPFNHKLGIKN